MPPAAWKQVAIRAAKEASEDNLGLVAAGVSFYGFLALLPLLGAIVLVYGLIADPQTVIDNMRAMMKVMPHDIAQLVGDQLMRVVGTSGGKKGVGLVIALALALFSARNGAAAIISALNIAYEEKEKRGFVKVTTLAFGITLAGVVIAVLSLLAIAALSGMRGLVPGPRPLLEFALRVASYVAFLAIGAGSAALLYRFGPSRDGARWAWLSPGSVLFSFCWVAVTLGFGAYVGTFGNYGATYGSLAAVVILLTWMYLSSYLLVLGAELNSELELQTCRDTTHGEPQPLGDRHAWVADHVAAGTDIEGRETEGAR